MPTFQRLPISDNRRTTIGDLRLFLNPHILNVMVEEAQLLQGYLSI
jgi:hypothetical protein